MISPQQKRPMVRCAIYTRKSTEEGLEMDYNSLEAQRDAAEAYIRSQLHEGWMLVQDRYDDPAYSGGNMERPALKRLIEDIKAGKVQMVVVYKIDRLSRSLMDFATLARLFEQYGASFTSVTEQFSTANAIGRLHLNMILSFAQFEREIASERIRDKIAASKKKGMWMGGSQPMGYTIKDRKLLVNPDEAKIVRGIFQRFTETHSFLTLARETREAGIRTRSYISKRGVQRNGQFLSVCFIHHMLRNPVYIGKIHHKGVLYDGQHEPLISQDLWDKVQGMIKTVAPGKKGRKASSETKSMLHGLVFCKCCSAPMTHVYTRKKEGRLYRYFSSSAVRRGVRDRCAVGNVSAPMLEETVIAQIRAIMRQPQAVTSVWQKLHEMETPLPEETVRRRLLNLDKVWGELFPAEQRKLVALMVQRVEMTPQGANLHMHVNGLEELLRQLARNNEEEEDASDTEEFGNLRVAYPGDHAADEWPRADHGAGGFAG